MITKLGRLLLWILRILMILILLLWLCSVVCIIVYSNLEPEPVTEQWTCAAGQEDRVLYVEVVGLSDSLSCMTKDEFQNHFPEPTEADVVLSAFFDETSPETDPEESAQETTPYFPLPEATLPESEDFFPEFDYTMPKYEYTMPEFEYVTPDFMLQDYLIALQNYHVALLSDGSFRLLMLAHMEEYDMEAQRSYWDNGLTGEAPEPYRLEGVSQQYIPTGAAHMVLDLDMDRFEALFGSYSFTTDFETKWEKAAKEWEWTCFFATIDGMILCVILTVLEIKNRRKRLNQELRQRYDGLIITNNDIYRLLYDSAGKYIGDSEISMQTHVHFLERLQHLISFGIRDLSQVSRVYLAKQDPSEGELQKVHLDIAHRLEEKVAGMGGDKKFKILNWRAPEPLAELWFLLAFYCQDIPVSDCVKIALFNNLLKRELKYRGYIDQLPEVPEPITEETSEPQQDSVVYHHSTEAVQPSPLPPVKPWPAPVRDMAQLEADVIFNNQEKIYIDLDALKEWFRRTQETKSFSYACDIPWTRKNLSLKFYVGGVLRHTYVLETQEGEDFNGCLFRCSIQLAHGDLGPPVALAAGYVYDPSQETAWELEYTRYRLEVVVLDQKSKHSKLQLSWIKGGSPYCKKIRYPNESGPIGDRMVGMCRDCNRSFTCTLYWCDSADETVVYSDDGLEAMRVDRNGLDPESWSSTSDGNIFRFSNPFRCPHCGGIYMNPEKPINRLHPSRYGLVHFGRQLYRDVPLENT